MSSEEKSMSLIEKLQESFYYCIDIFPKQVESERYFKIEEFCLGEYLKDYAEKISQIVILLSGYYKMEIYLTEVCGKKHAKLKELAGKNLAGLGYKKLRKIIKRVICEDISSVEILIPEEEFEISIGGGFNTAVYNIQGEAEELVKQLVESRQLFFRKIEE